ncbi:MAG: LLM class F420-dependent oxidoreductase [Deltaproteobacteria bacterium]|jgi:probable F420-dependent oxidoreductase|nr:LLM class F420-dependent oxidoreductase [Deltaproteobacteria bacterium]
MKFSAALPTDRVESPEAFCTAEAIATNAATIERLGFDACYVTEHPFPADGWLASGGHHALDPFVALAAAAMATTRLRLHTNIVVLPYHNPFLTAKAVASLDVVSGGRLIVGVAAGYLVDEFAALGVPFEERNERSDEAIPAMKAAWSGESVKLSGGSFEARGNTMLPVPLQKPHPPIWIGGNAPRAIRRAVDHAQGWSPFPLPRAATGRNASGAIESVEDLARGIRRMHEYAEQQGRTEPLDVNFVPFGMQMNRSQPLEVGALRDQLGALEEEGVNWVSVGMPTASQSAYLEALDEFAQHFLSS